MRRSCIAWVLVVVGLLHAAPAGAAVITFDSQTLNPNDPFRVDILISDVTDLFGFQFDLTFDPTVVSLTGRAEEGTFFSSALPGALTFFSAGFLPGELGENDPPLGTIALIAGNLAGVTSGVSTSALIPTGVLASLEFMAIGVGDANIALTNVFLLGLSEDVFSDIACPPGDCIVNGAVNVVPEPSTLALVGLGLLTLGRRLRRRA